MTQQQNPLERAVDLFVFAPIGVAMFAKDAAPTFLKMFVSRGQTEIQHRKKSLHDQANQYRVVGRFAVRYGGPQVRRQAGTKLDEAVRRAEETFSGLVVSRARDTTAEPPRAAPVREPARVSRATVDKPIDKPAKPETRGGTVGSGAPTGGTTNGHAPNGERPNGGAKPRHVAPALAIPEYDQLSASQVVERLDGLTSEELDAVRAYELAHRGRSTILGKITQLTA